MRSFICFLLFASVASKMYSESDDYLRERARILKTEKTVRTGGKIKLNAKEKEVDKLILKEKNAELLRAHENVSEYLPSQHFFQAKAGIDKSKVFSIIKSVPKGASLHTHMLAAVSVDFIVENITYRDNVYGCFLNGTFKLMFLQNAKQDSRCIWKELKEYRKEDADFDGWLRRQLSLEVQDPAAAYPSINDVWQRFKRIFTTVYDMLCYKPAFEDYVYQLLKELYDDNVMYTELRGTFMPLYELNGTVYSTAEFFDTFIATVEKFKRNYPRFVGVRYIHSIYRGVSVEVLRNGLDELIRFKNMYPNFIAGFDFVGYEEEGKQIADFHEVLAEAGKHLKFFFHSGETSWYGHTDLNLIDAVLLNTSRIGHGFGLLKHPVLLDMVKARNLPIELCPISNQVLMLNQDPRTHPSVYLIGNGFPVVIGNDDPSAWGATGLSYDWYVVFMAMTSQDAGIETLKQLAMDSIIHSAMAANEKMQVLEKWEIDWETFLDDMLARKDS